MNDANKVFAMVDEKILLFFPLHSQLRDAERHRLKKIPQYLPVYRCVIILVVQIDQLKSYSRSETALKAFLAFPGCLHLPLQYQHVEIQRFVRFSVWLAL